MLVKRNSLALCSYKNPKKGIYNINANILNMYYELKSQHEGEKKSNKQIPTFIIIIINITIFSSLIISTDMGRSVIVILIVAFFVIFIAFWTGVAGCWRRSPGNITATAILMLLACKYLQLVGSIIILIFLSVPIRPFEF